ncbi:hypothetical protein BH24DEI2_BH24DEI2_12490 [soil metagenome]
MVDAARGCLAGLAVGDALGQPTEGWTRQAIADKWGYLEGFVGDIKVSDDTEYTLFSAQAFLRYGLNASSQDFAAAWLEHIVPHPGPFKGAGFSEMAAIDNLRRGLLPPQSGRHYHSWSDGLAMRVAPCGILAAGNPILAAHLAEIDGSVSHDGEGIYAGQAVAAAQAVAMTAADLNQADLDQIIEAALSVIPENSWTARNINLALELVSGRELREVLEPLYDVLAVTYYPWTDLGPEAVGLAFGLLAAGRGDFRNTVLAAVNLGRDTDTVAAIVGSILGAQQGMSAIPTEWLEVLRPATGICLTCVRGVDLLETADALVTLRNGSP